MSYNGSGTFNINSSGQPVVTGTVISSTTFNALTADLGTGLTTAITKDGQTVATVRIPFAAGINSSLVTDSTSTTTGSIITAGGVGVAKALFVGTTANIAGTTTLAGVTATSITDSGTLAVTGATTLSSTLAVTGITTVAAGSAALPAIVSTTGTADTGLWFPAADTVAASTAGSERMRIDSSGNVGIGTASPNVKLEVAGPDTAAGAGIRLSRAADTTNFWDIFRDGTTGILNFKQYGAAASAMVIDTNGRIQTGGLTVVDSARISVSFDSANSTGVSYKALAGSGGTVSTMVNSSGTGIGSITCTNTNVAFNTSSDYRLKNTVAPMTGALDKVALLKPCTYKWNVDGSDGQGFIAHELQSVVPNCVSGEKDGTREEEYEVTPAVPAVVGAEGVETTPAVQAVKGTRAVPSYQGVDTSFLVATLTAAIQELKAIIDTQATRIAALEAAR